MLMPELEARYSVEAVRRCLEHLLSFSTGLKTGMII
jgi:hypothetical protein